MSNYLRNRPFMVVTYTYVLSAGQKSQARGFMETAQWEPVENMVIVDRVSTKQMQTAELVLDLLENKVLKCRDGSLNHKEVFDRFVARHFDDVKAALAGWITKDPANLQKVQAFVDSHKTNKEAGDVEGDSN